MERYTSCLASLSPCGKCDSKVLVFFQLDLYTVWGSFIVNSSPYNTQNYFLPEFSIHKSFLILTLSKLKSRWFFFFFSSLKQARKMVRKHLGTVLVLCSCLWWISHIAWVSSQVLGAPLGQLQLAAMHAGLSLSERWAKEWSGKWRCYRGLVVTEAGTDEP